MTALNRKLIRDLYGMKTQAAAIAVVIAAGVATFVMSLSTLESLSRSKDTYYDRYRFAHVFAHLKRAPDTLVARIGEIQGRAEERWGSPQTGPGERQPPPVDAIITDRRDAGRAAPGHH